MFKGAPRKSQKGVTGTVALLRLQAIEPRWL